MATYSALLKGAGRVWTADHQPDRLRKAEELGAIPINTAEQNPADVVKEATLGLGATTAANASATRHTTPRDTRTPASRSTA